MGLVMAGIVWMFAMSELGGATVTASNFDGPRSNLIGRDDGSFFTNGIVWIGTFTLEPDAIGAAVENGQLEALHGKFVQFGRATAVFFNGLPGLYQDVMMREVVEGDAFAGQAIYTVISDQGLLRDAGQLMIFQHNQEFLPDPLRNEPAILQEGEGELIVGEFGRFRGSLGQIIDQPMFTLQRVKAIPEPESAILLLVALGVLGGLWSRSMARDRDQESVLPMGRLPGEASAQGTGGRSGDDSLASCGARFWRGHGAGKPRPG